MEIYGVIYCLKSPSGKYYIGQTTNFKKRMNGYKRCHCKGQPKLFKAIQKYGFSNFEIKIICHCFDAEDMDSRERHCISIFDSLKNGYNADSGGRGQGRMTEETKRKISKIRKGVKHRVESIKKIQQALMGKKVSEATRAKMREYHSKKTTPYKGRPCSEEAKEKIRKAHLGKGFSTQRKTNISDATRDRNIYCFRNLISGEKFCGERKDFELKYGFKTSVTFALKNGKYKTYKGWILTQE